MKLQSYYTDFIKNKAIDLGFISCGISKSGFLNDEVNRFENGLKIIIMEKCHIWKILIKEWIQPN